MSRVAPDESLEKKDEPVKNVNTGDGGQPKGEPPTRFERQRTSLTSKEGIAVLLRLAKDVKPTCFERFWVASSPLRQTFTWADTVFPNVVMRPMLWIGLVLSLISVSVRCAWEEAEDAVAADGSHFAAEVEVMSTTISMLNWAMLFYMVFYNSVGYSRWMANWECTQIGYGRINDLNVLVPAYMQKTPKLAADVLRFVNAYHHFVYFSTIGQGVREWDEYALRVCQQRKLLTEKEVDVMRPLKGSKGMRCLIWASQTIANSGIDAHFATQLNEQIVLLRRAMAYIWSYDDQMLPFAYTHAMNFFVLLMVLMKSSLSGFDYSKSMLESNDRVQPIWLTNKVLLIVGNNFLWVFAILVLREVSQIIADPFSNGKNGINAERYLDLHVSGTSKLVYDSAKHPVDDKEDPDFASMAHSDPEAIRKIREEVEKRRENDEDCNTDDELEKEGLREWQFKPRPTRNIKYMRTSRKRALRLKSGAAHHSLGEEGSWVTFRKSRPPVSSKVSHGKALWQKAFETARAIRAAESGSVLPSNAGFDTRNGQYDSF